ncbi:DUF6580 family putative transport protein [Solitalea lacus]|uniref:DUF6580 family putative transport protein n=1 Tax=Solitalea lacus TaxID=2911172 RepID=UPI001EDA7DD1|nr:DUF6580 family putative transport protein [Solitalea lacus]UKJ06285.1 hypothetical protein L2B55_12135 [Solitalea lacus]
MNNKPRIFALLSFIALALISRIYLFPTHGFAPIDAIAIFSGAYFGRNWLGFISPLIAVWISDQIVNLQFYHKIVPFYDGFYWQYGCYILMVIIASIAIKKPKALNIAACAVASGLLFFIITNFGVWAGGTMYPMNLTGLTTCYIAGLPYLNTSILANFIYCALLFGGFELVKYRFPVLAHQA